jgi:hypothetical protein
VEPLLQPHAVGPVSAKEVSMQVLGSDIDVLIERIQAEYREMPGLSLTGAQACRVWQIDDLRCTAILATLVQAKFLARTPSGTYVRAS